MDNEYVELRGESYYIRGTRVSLDSIVYGYLGGDSPEAIHENVSFVTAEQVYGGIAFYLANRQKIDAYLAAKRKAFAEARCAQPALPSDLRARIEQARELTHQS
jgi:uncharacterized protein (DUF433 family)